MLSLDLGGARLEALEPWRAADFARFTDEHREELIGFLPWADRIRDVDGAREFLQSYADRTAADGGRIYGIRVGDELVGGTVFRTFDVEASVAEIGVWLAASARGRGLVTTAVERMIAWATEVRGIRRVEWRCVPSNLPSIAAAQRLGFALEETLPESFEHLGRMWDLQVWVRS